MAPNIKIEALRSDAPQISTYRTSEFAATQPSAQLVSDLARALQDIVASTDRPAPAIPVHRPTAKQAVTEARDAAEPAVMPQILQHRPTTGRDAATPAPARWRVGQIVAPAILALALVGVAILMFAPGASVGPLQSHVQQGARQPASIAGTLIPSQEITASLDASGAQKRPALTLDDLLLIERAEAMLERGDIIGARRELAEAAAAGNAHAKFALAETFDPNMLAARGLRVPVADAGTARALYTQALAAGDSRAQRRLEGLQQAK